jgi:hypothetical protein
LLLGSKLKDETELESGQSGPCVKFTIHPSIPRRRRRVKQRFVYPNNPR